MNYDIMLSLSSKISEIENRHRVATGEISNLSSGWISRNRVFVCRQCDEHKMLSEMWQAKNYNSQYTTGKLCIKCYYLSHAKKSLTRVIINCIKSAHPEINDTIYKYSSSSLPEHIESKYDIDSVLTEDILKLKSTLLIIRAKLNHLKNNPQCNQSTQNQCLPCSHSKWTSWTDTKLMLPKHQQWPS